MFPFSVDPKDDPTEDEEDSNDVVGDLYDSCWGADDEEEED